MRSFDDADVPGGTKITLDWFFKLFLRRYYQCNRYFGGKVYRFENSDTGPSLTGGLKQCWKKETQYFCLQGEEHLNLSCWWVISAKVWNNVFSIITAANPGWYNSKLLTLHKDSVTALRWPFTHFKDLLINFSWDLFWNIYLLSSETHLIRRCGILHENMKNNHLKWLVTFPFFLPSKRSQNSPMIWC